MDASPGMFPDSFRERASFQPSIRLETARNSSRLIRRYAGRVHGDADALRRADAMFSWDPLPWCPEVF